MNFTDSLFKEINVRIPLRNSNFGHFLIKLVINDNLPLDKAVELLPTIKVICCVIYDVFKNQNIYTIVSSLICITLDKYAVFLKILRN